MGGCVGSPRSPLVWDPALWCCLALGFMGGVCVCHECVALRVQRKREHVSFRSCICKDTSANQNGPHQAWTSRQHLVVRLPRLRCFPQHTQDGLQNLCLVDCSLNLTCWDGFPDWTRNNTNNVTICFQTPCPVLSYCVKPSRFLMSALETTALRFEKVYDAQ